MSSRKKVFITAAELAQRLEAGAPTAILDVRWQLTEPDGRAAYELGHLPDAVYVSLEDELTDHRARGRGRHPLPSGRDLEAAARRWGLRTGAAVVVYDDWNRAGSARAWWVLSAAGIADVRILDGGLAAWIAAGGALQTGPATPAPGDVTVTHHDLYAGALPTVTAAQVAEPGRVLIDARAPERYRGDVEPVDPVAGHIPGARNLPAANVLAGDGTLAPAAELTRMAADHIADGSEVAVYCGSGVTAATTLAALAAAGMDAALFPGSWSEWISEPSRPVASGES